MALVGIFCRMAPARRCPSSAGQRGLPGGGLRRRQSAGRADGSRTCRLHLDWIESSAMRGEGCQGSGICSWRRHLEVQIQDQGVTTYPWQPMDFDFAQFSNAMPAWIVESNTHAATPFDPWVIFRSTACSRSQRFPFPTSSETRASMSLSAAAREVVSCVSNWSTKTMI